MTWALTSTGCVAERAMLGRKGFSPRIAALVGIFPALQVSRGLQATSRLAATLETNQEAFELVQWIVAGGGYCDSVQIAFQEKAGQTLTTTQAVKKGKLLVSLPRSRQLSAESPDSALQGLIDKVPSDLWAARLALPIIAERAKGSGSTFLPYLQSLPAGISGLPLFFRPEEIQQLQYMPLVQQINLRCRWLLRFASDELRSDSAAVAFSGAAVDVNLLGWGMGCASSRAFRIGPSAQPSMLPLIDLCNHSFDPNCKLESAADGTARLVACQDIQAEQPLNINYGNLSNTTLLQDYGFIVPDNPFDEVQISLSTDHIQVAQTLGGVGIPKEPEPWQADRLAQLGAAGKGSAVSLRRSDPMFDGRLVAAVRVLCAVSSEELEGRSDKQLGDLEAPLSSRGLEWRALQTLATVCAQLIAGLGTRLEDDRRLLSKEPELSHNSRLAVHYRIQLKKFIQAAMALVLNKLKRLQSVT